MPAKIQKEGVISVFDFFQMFPDQDSAQEYIEMIRWGSDVCCPHCDSERVTKLKRKGYYLCNECRQKFRELYT